MSSLVYIVRHGFAVNQILFMDGRLHLLFQTTKHPQGDGLDGQTYFSKEILSKIFFNTRIFHSLYFSTISNLLPALAMCRPIGKQIIIAALYYRISCFF